MIYNAAYPLAAPDVIFGPEDENFRPYRVIGEASDSKSLKNPLTDWNSRDPTRLFSLVLQLRCSVYCLLMLTYRAFIMKRSSNFFVKNGKEELSFSLCGC